MRVGYIDEQSRQGELDMSQIRVGDLVRFIADFDKHGVGQNEIGEVVATYPEAMRVSAPGRKVSGSGLDIGPVEVDVMPMDVLVLVDSRDDRISSYRIDAARHHEWDRSGERCTRCGAKDWMDAPCHGGPDNYSLHAAVSVDDLSTWVEHLALGGVPVADKGVVALESLRRGVGRMARVAQAADQGGWSVFVAALGFGRVAKSLPSGASVEVVQMAERSMGDAFQAEHGRPADLSVRQDALWLVRELHQDIIRASMEDEFTLEETEEGYVPHGPGYDDLELNEGPGGELVPGNGAGGGSFWERELANVEMTLDAIRETPDEVWAQEMAPHKPKAPAEGVYLNPKPTGEPYPSGPDPVFEQVPRPSGLTPEQEAKLLSSVPSSYSEEYLKGYPPPPGGSEPQPPPEAPKAPPRLEAVPGGAGAGVSLSREDAPPIKVPSYIGTYRIWAEPGMRVYKAEGGTGGGEGTIVGFSRSVPDGVVVQLDNGQDEIWDSVSVTLAVKKWNGKPTKVPEADMDAWKKRRREHLKRKRGSGAGERLQGVG